MFKLKSNLEAQTPAQVDAAAKTLCVPDALTWGIDADGKVVGGRSVTAFPR